MPHDEVLPSPLTRSLLEALSPILRRVSSERTLSPGKISILRHLDAHGRATTGQLAVAIRVSPQGVSLAARELERLGLVTRAPDEDDRRKAWIVMTEEGRETLAQQTLAGKDWLEQAIADLAADERELLETTIPVLRKLASEPLNG